MAYPIKISAMNGVHGDGIADDSAAITAALAQAAQTPNGVVLVDGKYYFNQTITVPAGVTVLGYGRAGEIVDKSPQDTHDADASNYFATLGSVLYYGANATLVLSARTSPGRQT